MEIYLDSGWRISHVWRIWWITPIWNPCTSSHLATVLELRTKETRRHKHLTTMVAEILTAREQMHCHAHRHSTDQCSKQLDKWFNVKHCSAVPSTVRYFASRCCGIPKHRISGCSEHYTTKPLKLFRFIVLWRSYVIYTYLKYQNTYNIKHDIYLYKYILSPMKGQNYINIYFI